MTHNGAEDRLEVKGRADRLTNLTQRSQLTDRLRELPRAGLQFLKQPNILDSDDSLIGKSFKESDLPVGERTDLQSADHNSANRDPLSQQRRSKYSAMSKAFLVSQRLLKFWFGDRR